MSMSSTLHKQHPRSKPGRAGGIALAFAAMAGAVAPAWAGSWNAAKETIDNHPTWIYTPGSALANGKHALVIALHGCAQTNDDLKSWGNLAAAAEHNGAVIAVPGVGSKVWSGNTSAACWDYDGASDASGHIAELVSLTQDLLARGALNIDSRHVYIVGLSSGASVALDVACKAPNLIAGVGALAGPSVGSAQFSATVDQSGILSSNVSNAVSKCNSLAGANSSYFATQIANLAYGEKDRNAESPGCTYLSGSTSCPGQYQLVSKKWDSDNVAMFQQIYGTGTPGSAATVYNGTGETSTATAGGVPRITLTRVYAVGHAWPAGSGQANDASKGGVWMAQSGMNYGDYVIGWLIANNRRADIPSVALNISVAATTIHYSGTVASTDPIQGTRAQLYAWNASGNGYQASGQPVNLSLGAGGSYGGDFSVPNNNWYRITVTATTTANATGSATAADIGVGSPPAQWQCNTVTATNYSHVQNGRAYDNGGYAYAKGSNQRLAGGGGLDNTFYSSTLSQSAQGYWINGSCP